jgi:hypothetical protein
MMARTLGKTVILSKPFLLKGVDRATARGWMPWRRMP